MAEISRRRIGELQRAVFQVLLNHPDGLRVQDIEKEAEALLPATPFENEDYPSTPGRRRYPTMLRFSTITAVKAGWLNKDKGTWRLTEDGRAAYQTYSDPAEFEKAAIHGYRAWASANKSSSSYDPDEAAEDAIAVDLERSESPRHKAWLVRGANVDSENVLPIWFSEGICSIAFDLPDLAPGTQRAAIARQVLESFPDLHPNARGNMVGVVDRFLNIISVGDLVVTVDRNKIYVGTVESGPQYSPHMSTRLRRKTSWRNVARPFARGELSTDAADGLRSLLTIVDLTRFMAEFARLSGVELDPLDETTVDIEVQIPIPDELLARRLLLPLDWLLETVDLLNDKRQIVLYGPPGTGKTYLAQELCKALVEAVGGEYTIVQFHPSYAYEDFFEGLRPTLSQDGSGGVTFGIVPGPLRRIAKLADAAPARPFVLIIDEINRANLAKVFGELYFLLEYRGQAVNIQYSDEEFRLPRNLFLIGTMNTADRSIALVDAAMRRRFYFQGLFPDEEPIKSVLVTWLADHNLSPEPAHLLNALNDAINDPDFAIGPSYLMTRRAGDGRGLERIWKTAILPLLVEHYYGEGRDIEGEFGIAALRRTLARGDIGEKDESAPDVAESVVGAAAQTPIE